MISSLGSGALVILVPPVVVSSVTASLWVVGLSRGEFECLEESLTCLGELSCCLPFHMGFAGLFFPLFEGPGMFCSGVKVWGINDGASESFLHPVLQGFDGSFVV